MDKLIATTGNMLVKVYSREGKPLAAKPPKVPPALGKSYATITAKAIRLQERIFALEADEGKKLPLQSRVSHGGCEPPR